MLEYSLGGGIQFCLNGFTDLLVLTDPLDAEPAPCFRAVLQLSDALLEALGFECPLETSAVQDVTLSIDSRPLVVSLPKRSDGIETTWVDHAFLGQKRVTRVHFFARPCVCILDFGRHYQTGLIPPHRAFDGPRQDRRLGFRRGEQRFEVCLDLGRAMLEWDSDEPPPDRRIVRGHERQMVHRQKQFELWPIVKTILIEESRVHFVATCQLLQGGFRETLAVVALACCHEARTGQSRDVFAGPARNAVFFQES